MGRPRFENLDLDRKNRLFDSAAEEFSEKGYTGASLNKILEKSGMSKSSLYYYFDDKTDLFVSLAERSLGYLFREVGGFDPAQLTADNYWDSLEQTLRQMLGIMVRDVWYAKLARMLLRLRDQPKGVDRTKRLYEAGTHMIGSVLSRGQELGVIRTDLPQSMLIDATMGLGETMDRWMLERWEDLDDDERETILVANLDMFRRLLEKPYMARPPR